MDFVCRQPNFFKNPHKLPLNELQLEIKTIKRKKKLPNDQNIEDIKDTVSKNYDVRLEKKPALHYCWIQKEHSYYKYQPYYSEVAKEENELFSSSNTLFLENLQFLLHCNYHQFWNYIVFEPRIKTILRSFLFNPVQMYELKYLGEYLKLYNDIYNKVAAIYLRILTYKESNVEFMSKDTVLKLLEVNKIITYADIINIFMLYNKTNPDLITKVHELFFSDNQSSKYTKELVKIFNHFLLIFDMVGGQICGFKPDSIVIPIGIRSRPPMFDPYWLEEVVTFVLDTAAALNAILSSCLPSIESAFSLGLPYRLTYFYNSIFPALYEMMQDRADIPPDLKHRILDHTAMTRNEFVNAFHAFATRFIDDIIQSLGDNKKQDSYLERYLSLISAALEDEVFITDYHHAHHIDVQLQTLSDFHPQMDHMRTNYILECLSTLPTLETLKEMKVQTRSTLDFKLPPPASTSEENGFNDPGQNEKHVYTETEILDLTKSVADTLPHLGDGFIRECLKSYNYNTAEVISAVLDENLPPHLENLPRDLIYVPPEPEPPQPTLAYKGKKPDYKDATQLLNDKSEIQEVKDFVLKVSNISYDIYDDEYDDRYDDEPVLKFYDKTDDSSMYEHMGKRFEEYELVSDPSESSSDEEEGEGAGASKPKNAFCEDPAALRAKREANRTNKGRNHDVVGKPKGQGQDKNVLHNREKKTVHKSSRANHNRKTGAQWKRNKGMIPS
ncbi:hypothetical protein Trydic_g3266 [Trypoxylus dichotomus]